MKTDILDQFKGFYSSQLRSSKGAQFGHGSDEVPGYTDWCNPRPSSFFIPPLAVNKLGPSGSGSASVFFFGSVSGGPGLRRQQCGNSHFFLFTITSCKQAEPQNAINISDVYFRCADSSSSCLES